jgi:archaellum component FlaC
MDDEKYTTIIELLLSLDAKIDKLQNTINGLNDKTTDIEKDCEQMSNHIHFVESVYNVVRKPLSYFVSTKESPELPALENN